MEFSRQEYWGGLPSRSLGDLSDPGAELGSPSLKANSLLSGPPGTWFQKLLANEQSVGAISWQLLEIAL